ncbi:DUF3795 domain-containing protein [candidate division KSB1 bacterium]|nr:DUF3795 domain-containing protein [candidate division KSB1 bacterium]
MIFIDKLKYTSVCGICCETECCIMNAYISNNIAFRRQLGLLLLKDADRWRNIRCDGCKGEQSICWEPYCPIKACAYSHGFEFCIECDKYPCAMLIKKQQENEVTKKIQSYQIPMDIFDSW